MWSNFVKKNLTEQFIARHYGFCDNVYLTSETAFLASFS